MSEPSIHILYSVHIVWILCSFFKPTTTINLRASFSFHSTDDLLSYCGCLSSPQFSHSSSVRTAITIGLINTMGFFCKISEYILPLGTCACVSLLITLLSLIGGGGVYRALPVGLNSKTSPTSHISCVISPILGYFLRKRPIGSRQHR